MKNSSTWLSPRQAGDLVGYSARHIQNLITKGKISATKEDGKYYIEKSEFFRLFPDAHKKEQEANPQDKEVARVRMEVENAMLKEISSQKDKEIEFLRSQLESFNREKEQMLEAINHHARLLEHKEAVKSETSSSNKKSWIDRFKRDKN